MKPKKRANLRDVASAAGVSVATVSRVLNSPQSVSDDTRRRVQEVIDSLHFVPSAAARAINSGRTRVVGALVPTLDNAIFSKFLAALEARLGDHGLSLVVATTEGDPEVEAAKAKGLVNIGAEALIVSGVTHSPAFDALLARTRLPAIATSYFDPSYHLPTIGYDNAEAARMVLRHLVGAGHRNIAVLHGPRHHNDRTRARLDGLSGVAENVAIHCYETGISVLGGAGAVDRLLAHRVRCSAVMCTSDVIAMGAMFELQRRGVKLPDDMSLIGIDDLPFSAVACPGITSVHLPVSKMGHLAAEAVIEWIEQGKVPEAKLIPVNLVVRQSTCEVTDGA